MGLIDAAVMEEAYAAYEAAAARIASLDYTGLPVAVLLALQSRRETLKCAAEAVDHQILAAAQTQATAKEIGAKDWAEVLHIRHRIGWEEARRRVRDADNLGPRSAITGEPLGPVWELVAAALAEGAINVEHVAVITNFFAKVPLWVDPTTLLQCEADLVAAARYQTPEELRAAAKDLLYRDSGGWTTTMGPNGRAHWTPPPLLDIGQPRTNQYHHPTLYPSEGEDGDGESDSPTD